MAAESHHGPALNISQPAGQSQEAFRLTHTRDSRLAATAQSEGQHHIAWIPHTAAWPITNSDISSAQRPGLLSLPWEGLQAQQFWRAADNPAQVAA